MKKYRIIYLDAFTRVPFTGNPCAVLPEAEGLTDDQMQKIARETNLSETAFVFPSDKADVKVRYFMPHKEIPFAGHPTIATAFMLALEEMIQLLVMAIMMTSGVVPVMTKSMVVRETTFSKEVMATTCSTVETITTPWKVEPVLMSLS